MVFHAYGFLNSENFLFFINYQLYTYLKYGIEAIIIVKDGYLKQLEVHTYGEDFPGSSENIDSIIVHAPDDFADILP